MLLLKTSTFFFKESLCLQAVAERNFWLLHHCVPSVCLIIFHRVVIVENIPEDISFLQNGTSHVPLSVGLNSLLDRAVRVVEIVSPLWLLNASDYESSFQPAARRVIKVYTFNKQSSHDRSRLFVWFLSVFKQHQTSKEGRTKKWPITKFWEEIILLLSSQIFIFNNAPNTTAEVKLNKASNTRRAILC